MVLNALERSVTSSIVFADAIAKANVACAALVSPALACASAMVLNALEREYKVLIVLVV